MKYINELKNIDTQHKAYLLGLAYADGYVSNKVFKIALAEDDVYVLMNIQREIPMLKLNYMNALNYKNSLSKRDQYALCKNTKELCKDLERHGLISAKSKSKNSDLLQYPNIPNEFDKDFIRGLFDGDGSISTPLSRPLSRHLEIGMVNKLFITQLQEKLKEYNILLDYREVQDNRNNRLPRYILKSQNYENISKFGNFIYENSLVHLHRKKEYFDTLQNPLERQSEIYNSNPDCPNCGSKITTSNGFRGKKKRYKCKECTKGFSI